MSETPTIHTIQLRTGIWNSWWYASRDGALLLDKLGHPRRWKTREAAEAAAAKPPTPAVVTDDSQEDEDAFE